MWSFVSLVRCAIYKGKGNKYCFPENESTRQEYNRAYEVGIVSNSATAVHCFGNIARTSPHQVNTIRKILIIVLIEADVLILITW